MNGVMLVLHIAVVAEVVSSPPIDKCKTVNKVFVKPLLLSARHLYHNTADIISAFENT